MRERRYLAALLCLLLVGGGCRRAPEQVSAIPVYSYEIVQSYPHDPRAFTQGLQFHDGVLYESTGLHGASSLRRVDLETGRVERRLDLPEHYFGEGIAVVGDRIYMLTWRSGQGFVIDREQFRVLDRFSYDGEGWGLAYDGRHLIMSDGTSRLRFLEPETAEVTRTVRVTADGEPVERLNELAWIDGELWANVWKTDRLARMDPESGRVTAWVDLTGLLQPEHRAGRVDVLNGIAYDPDGRRLFVTGKLWPRLYEIRVVPPAR